MATWLDFWNGEHRLYVNERHRDVHYRRVADEIAGFVPSSEATVLDYGPGDALHADRIAARCGRLILCEAAQETRKRLGARFAENEKIVVMGPERLTAEADGSVDLIVANSVAQYLSVEEFDGFLKTARRLLAREGKLLIADVIPPDAGAVSDAAALLAFARQEKFLAAAVAGLAATAVSPYRKIRNSLGLMKFNDADMLKRLAEAGFQAERAPANLGHNQKRTAFIART